MTDLFWGWDREDSIRIFQKLVKIYGGLGVLKEKVFYRFMNDDIKDNFLFFYTEDNEKYKCFLTKEILRNQRFLESSSESKIPLEILELIDYKDEIELDESFLSQYFEALEDHMCESEDNIPTNFHYPFWLIPKIKILNKDDYWDRKQHEFYIYIKKSEYSADQGSEEFEEESLEEDYQKAINDFYDIKIRLLWHAY